MGQARWQRYKTRKALGKIGRIALRHLAQGHTLAQTAQHTGLCAPTIHRMAQSPAGSRYLAACRARLDAAAREARLALELEREAGEQEP